MVLGEKPFTRAGELFGTLNLNHRLTPFKVF
jgi:hypothetical protein